MLLTEQHHIFHNGITAKNKESCSDCVKDISNALNIDSDEVYKLKKQGHFIYFFNNTLTNDGAKLTYYYFGDFKRNLLPSDTLLSKLLEENEFKEKCINFIHNLYQ